jgi:hypothetical protein
MSRILFDRADIINIAESIAHFPTDSRENFINNLDDIGKGNSPRNESGYRLFVCSIKCSRSSPAHFAASSRKIDSWKAQIIYWAKFPLLASAPIYWRNCSGNSVRPVKGE